MVGAAHEFDLAGLALSAGEGKRIELLTVLDAVRMAGQRYAAAPASVKVLLDVSRMNSNGYSLRLRFAARIAGPCMRCLEPAAPQVKVDAREIDQPGDAEELSSPYVNGDTLRLADWGHDALALASPAQILCREDCAGLCPICAANINDAGPEHGHATAPDPRWAKLGDLKLD